MNILEKITNELGSFSKSERKVAEVILAEPTSVIHASIATLAKKAKISEPTVNRFCRRLDTKGYPDFKLHLAQSLANGTPYVNIHVNENDNATEYTKKIFDSTIANLSNARNTIDISAVNQAVDLLTKANKISFFGLGASAVVAHDALNKFFPFNIPVTYFDDILMQRMSAINSAKDDILIVISHTGRTKVLVEIAHLAKENNATVIGITTLNSPLAKECDVVLAMDINEDTDLYMPMSSRIAQLMVVDILATGFSLRRGTKFRDDLKKVKDSLRSSRFERED